MQCPQPNTLLKLLDEALPADEQQAIHAHLETCPACQQTIERLAAGGKTWDKAAENLAAKPAREETALLAAVEKLNAPSTHDSNQTQAEPGGGANEDDLYFLQPSQKPGSIGRLDEFEILSVVGKGGFGIVLKAFDETLHRVVAVKVLAPQMAASGAARTRFLREARAAAPISHENVVTIHKVSPDPAKFPYLAMQFVSGVTLSEKLEKSGPLSVKEILRIGMQSAEGLAAAHKQGLVHRDIKPGNILLENGVERVKITDFGLARAKDDASVTQSGTVAGTPMYMSPEQAAGAPIDHRSDLFSLGSVLYVMCTGRAPFRATTTLAVMKRVAEDTPTPVREINPEIPDWLAAIIARLHAKKPEDRFQDAREVADLFAQHLSDLQAGRDPGRAMSGGPTITTPAAATVTHAAPSQSVKTKSRAPIWLLVAALLLCVVGGPGLVIGLGAFAWLGLTLQHGDNVRPAPIVEEQPIVKVGKDPVASKKIDVAIVNPAPKEDGWVQLFNGKDLTEWKTHPNQPGDWKVEDGAIVGRGPKTSHLFSERRNFGDFHLRFETKLTGSGNGGVFFRAPFQLPIGTPLGSAPDGFVAHTLGDGKTVSVGQLFYLGPKPALAVESIKPDTWIAIDIIAQGDRIVVKVNGMATTEYTDTVRKFAAGHLALQVAGADAIAHYRKIEIKELPPPERDWVQLFNGKDLTGWNRGKEHSGVWKAENGRIIGTGHQAWLMSDRTDFADFHLRMRCKYVKGTAQLVLRGQGERSGDGYWLFMNNDPGNMQTGALMTSVDFKGHTTIVKEKRTRPDEWFTLEVIARGKDFQTFVNGEKALEWTDPSPRNVTQGSLRLYVFGQDAELHVERIEIKELPATPQPAASHALQFDGVSSRVDIPTLKVSLQNPFTVEMRVKVDWPLEVDKETALLVGSSVALTISPQQHWVFWAGNTKVPATLVGDGLLKPEQWVHLAAVCDGKTRTFYVDGKKQKMTMPADPPALTYTAGFTLGNREKETLRKFAAFRGSIADLRVSKTARYGKDFTPAPRFEADTDTIALYRFDPQEKDRLVDSSGNNHHGKIVGAKWVKADHAPAVPPAAFALQFDGSGRVEVPGLSLTGADSFTLEGYVSRAPVPPLPAPRILNFVGTSFMLALWKSSHKDDAVRDRLSWQFEPKLAKSDFLGGPRLDADRPIHIAAVRSGKKYELFVNGMSVAVKAVPDSPASPAGVLHLGADFAGSLAEIRISKVARYQANFSPAKRFTPDADTLALYHCDEGSADKLVDSSGNNHHGKIVRAKWVARNAPAAPLPPPGNYALEFDGKTSHVVVPALKLETDQPITIELKVKFAKAQGIVEDLTTFATPKGALTLARMNGNGVFLARHGQEANFAGLNTPIPDGEWTHLAGVWDGKKARLYINGKAQPGALVNPVPPEAVAAQSSPFYLGVDQITPVVPLNGYFHGLMDEIRVSKVARYDKDFTPRDRHDLDKDTIALYHCDEGAGEKLADSSGNEHHGKIIGARWSKIDAPAPIKPQKGAVLQIDGKDNYVDLPAALTFDGKQPLTIECYVHTDDLMAVMPIVGNRTMTEGISLSQIRKAQVTVFSARTSRRLIESRPIDLQKRWRHVALVYEKERLRLFVDGQGHLGRDEVFKGPTEPPAKASFRVGAMPDAVPGRIDFHGKIRELRFSGVARYREAFVPELRFTPDADTLALYHCDEDSGDKLVDSSGNNHHGNIVGAKWMTLDDLPMARRFKNSLGMEFALVPRGKSWLGGGASKPGTKEVEFKDDFYLGVHEVTQEQWQKVMTKNPSVFSRTGVNRNDTQGISDDELKRFPVENVSWNDAQEFLKLLNKMAPEPGWEYRLPTEAQWEYACRGGPMTDKAESAFGFYLEQPTDRPTAEQLNCGLLELKRPSKVGSFAPNRLGLYDMHGNVAEWCADDLPPDDKGISDRAVRGGSWQASFVLCGASSRSLSRPSLRHLNIGFRVANVRADQ